MPIALHTAGLASQSPQGVGARLVRRLGGAVRSAIIRGITLAGVLRRPATSKTGHHPAAPQDPQTPAPRRLSVPRPQRTPSTSTSPALRAKRAGEGAATLPPPWLARLLARRQHRPAWPNQGDIHFTPQAFPQLSPKACAVLNTPVKDCDPKTLELVVSAFTQHINQVMSPVAGITDPQAILPNLWHRISTALADTNADASLSTTPEALATPADVVPDAPLASSHPSVQAPPTAPASQWTNQAQCLSPLPLSGPPVSDQTADATITAAAPDTPPDIAAPSAPLVRRSTSLLYSTEHFARWRRRISQSSLPRRIRVFLCASVVPFSCCHYVACTGPP